MKLVLLLLLLQSFWTAGFSQTLSFKFGKPFKRPNLEIDWAAITNVLPSQVWEYKALPNHFSPDAIRELLVMGGFSPKQNCSGDTNILLFKNADETTSLWISYALGGIRYQTQHLYGPTNLAVGVPAMSSLPDLTTNFLKKLGVNMSEVEVGPDGTPKFNYWEPLTMFSVGTEIITNITYRAVSFRRSIDSAVIVGNGVGGDCEIEFGEHGKVQKIWMTWRKIERYKKLNVVGRDVLTKWIQSGEAFQRATRADEPPIDWRTVGKMRVTSMKICYYGGDTFAPSQWLIPFAALWTTISTPNDNKEIEIDCPVIDPAN